MFIDDQGFYAFKLCRSSDITEKKVYEHDHGSGENESGEKPPKLKQSIIMQVFTIYNEKLGRI